PVAILNSQRNRRTDRLPVPHSRKNLCPILLNFLPSTATVPQLPPVQLMINCINVNRQSRRQSRYKRQQRLPVRLTRSIEAQHKLSSVSVHRHFRPARESSLLASQSTRSRCNDIGPSIAIQIACRQNRFGEVPVLPGTVTFFRPFRY